MCGHPPLVAHEPAGGGGAEEAARLAAGVGVGHVQRRARHLRLAAEQPGLRDLLSHVEHLAQVSLVTLLASLVAVVVTVIVAIVVAIVLPTAVLLFPGSSQTLHPREQRGPRGARSCSHRARGQSALQLAEAG